MICPFELESYRNYRGDLLIGLRKAPGEAYFKVLTRSEAMALRDALALAIESYDTDEAHARMTSAYGGGR